MPICGQTLRGESEAKKWMDNSYASAVSMDVSRAGGRVRGDSPID